MFFARIAGCLDWACPACNCVQRTFVKARQYEITCKQCTSVFFRGLVLYKAPRGPKQPPPKDTLMIADGFAARRLVNRVYCDHCKDEIIEGVKKKMVDL